MRHLYSVMANILSIEYDTESRAGLNRTDHLGAGGLEVPARLLQDLLDSACGHNANALR